MRMLLLRHAARCRTPRSTTTTRRLMAPPGSSIHRFLSSTPPVPAASEPDWVRSAIQKMMMEQPSSTSHGDDVPYAHTEAAPPVDLPKALQSLQNQLQEAASCVEDCRDCPSNATELASELRTADQAIDQAVQCLLDVLEGSRAAPTPDNLPTDDWVQRIKQLRAQVKQLQPRTEPEPLTTTEAP